MLSQAFRSVVRRPAFAVAIIGTLAFGIAITTASFALVDAVLLKPLPYPSPDRLVYVMEASPASRERVSLVAPGRLADWNRLSRAFTVISGTYSENVTDTSGSEPERLAGRRVLPRYFDVFGTPPLLGRTFTPDEEQDGGPAVAVISEGFWTRRFARSPGTISQRLVIGGRSVTIVGVMPQAFAPPTLDVWMPAQLSPALLRMRQARFLSGVGRMRPGVTAEQARADLARVQAVLAKTYPATDAGWSADVTPLKEVLVGGQRRPLGLVFAAVALLFGVALANAAGLMLVQLRRRAGELAIRSALGASRTQVIAAVLREVALIASAGGAIGIGLAAVLVRGAAVVFTDIPRIAEAAVDGRVALFVAAATAASVVAFGLVPAWAATRAQGVRLVGQTRIAGGGHRLQSALVAAQVALGVLLAGGAGVLLRSYAALSGADTGFVASNVLTFHVAASWNEDRARIGDFQERLLSELQRLPQVRAAGFANFLPSTGATLRSQVTVEGLHGTDANGTLTTGERTVTAGYLPALQVPLVAGRWCRDSRMGVAEQHELMINRRFADTYGGGATLMGRHLAFWQSDPSTWTIVGVVGDAVEDTPAAPPAPYVYVCMPMGSWPDPEYAVRVASNPGALAPAVRAIVRQLDPSRPVFAVRPLDAVMAAAIDQPRLNAAALSVFAGAALALVAIGLYALLTLTVTERRRELGVRLALGASSGLLMRAVLAGAARLVGAGLVVGLVLLAWSGRFLRALVYGVTPHDPVALACGVAVLLIVTLAAAVVPLRRAAAVDPIEALRGE